MTAALKAQLWFSSKSDHRVTSIIKCFLKHNRGIRSLIEGKLKRSENLKDTFWLVPFVYRLATAEENNNNNKTNHNIGTNSFPGGIDYLYTIIVPELRPINETQKQSLNIFLKTQGISP